MGIILSEKTSDINNKKNKKRRRVSQRYPTPKAVYYKGQYKLFIVINIE